MAIECIEWTRCKNPAGYGNVRYRNRTFLVHRKEWIENYGEIPSGLHVLHKCDNPACYNIKHLFLGTQQDNMKDMNQKGRQAIGFNLPHTKLSLQEVEDIRQLVSYGYAQYRIAEMYSVGQDHISRLVNYKDGGSRGCNY